MDKTKCINYKIYKYRPDGEMEENSVVTAIPCQNLSDPTFSTFDFNDQRFDEMIRANFENDDFKFPSNYYKINPDKKFNIREQQRFIGRYATFLNDFHNGVLVYHGIGSGKTCAGIIAGEAYAYMHSNPTKQTDLRPNRRIILITPAQIQEQFKSEIQGKLKTGCVYSLSPDITYETPTIISSTSRSKKLEEDEKNKIFLPKWGFFTHVGFRNQIEKAYNEGYAAGSIYDILKKEENCLIIIDEAQNLITEIQDDKGKIYNTYIKFFMEIANQKHRIVLLSGTPIRDNPSQFGLLINLLNPRLYFPSTRKEFDSLFIRKDETKQKREPEIFNQDLFRWMIKGYVSYFKGGNPLFYPKKTIEYVYSEMNEEQLALYENFARQQDELEQQRRIDIENMEEDDNKFYGFLVKGQIICTTANKEILKHVTMVDGKLSDDSVYQIASTYSEKIAKVLTMAHQDKGKVFIYTDFLTNGANLLAGLFHLMGYEVIKSSTDVTNIKGKQKPRVALWTGGKALLERKNYNKEFMKIFNDESNDDGSFIKIIIGTKAIREGISFKEVNSVHILNPWWNQSVIEQVMGRAIRFGSHKGEEPEVKIYRHITIYPKFYTKEGEPDYQFNYKVIEEKKKEGKHKIEVPFKGRHSRLTADQIIEKKALSKQDIIRQFELEIKKSAVDCNLNKNGNLVRLTRVIDVNIKQQHRVLEYYLDESNGKVYIKGDDSFIENKLITTDVGNVKLEPSGNILTINEVLTPDTITRDMIKLENIPCESSTRTSPFNFKNKTGTIIEKLKNYTINVKSVGSEVIQALFNNHKIKHNNQLAAVTHCLIQLVKQNVDIEKFRTITNDKIDDSIYKHLGELGYPIGQCKIVMDKVYKKKELTNDETVLYTVISYIVREHNENIQRYEAHEAHEAHEDISIEKDKINAIVEEAENTFEKEEK